jgi:hypothetical protein
VYGTGAYDANKSFIDWICYERVSFDSKVVNWTSGYMIYVDSDLSISGSTTGYNDEDDDFEWNIDCTFKKGWNRYYIDYEYDKTSADLLVVTETTASQSNMDWVYDDDISLLLDAAFGSSLKIAKTEKKAFKIADGRKK